MQQIAILPKKCPPISFPFSLKGNHPDHCGYPGFVVSCNERNETILELPNTPVKFSIASIFYQLQEIQLYYPDNCSVVKFVGNQKMSVAPFIMSKTNMTLFNCSSVKAFLRDLSVPCLDIPGRHHIYAIDSSVAIAYLTSCTKMYNILSVPFSMSIKKIVLSWSKPNCTVCQEEGKECRLKNNSTAHKSEIECVHLEKSSRGKI